MSDAYILTIDISSWWIDTVTRSEGVCGIEAMQQVWMHVQGWMRVQVSSASWCNLHLFYQHDVACGIHPAFSLYTIFSGFIWQCPQNCHTGFLTGLHATFCWHCLTRSLCWMDNAFSRTPVNPLLGCEPTTSHLLGRHSSPLGHSVLGGIGPPLPKAHVTIRLERGK